MKIFTLVIIHDGRVWHMTCLFTVTSISNIRKSKRNKLAGRLQKIQGSKEREITENSDDE